MSGDEAPQTGSPLVSVGPVLKGGVTNRTVFCTFKGTEREKEGHVMRREMSITEARHALTSLPERLVEDSATLAVTRRGKPVLAVMRWDLYESIVETLEIMGDNELMAALRQGIKEIDAGRSISWEEARRELGL